MPNECLSVIALHQYNNIADSKEELMQELNQ
jgi:hypothetical protein